MGTNSLIAIPNFVLHSAWEDDVSNRNRLLVSAILPCHKHSLQSELASYFSRGDQSQNRIKGPSQAQGCEAAARLFDKVKD